MQSDTKTAYEKRRDERDRAISLLLDQDTRKAVDAVAKELYAQGASDEEVVAKVASLFVKEPTLGDAIMKSLNSPVRAGAPAGGGTPPSGAGRWAPQLSAKKAREEDEAKEVRMAANRLALEGADNVSMLKHREARKKREREGR